MNQSEEKKTRGRRPVVWICSNSSFEGFLINDKEPNSEFGSFPKEEAINKFKKKYGELPKFILGPFYEKKDNPTKKASIIRENISNIRLKAKQYPAIFNNWFGIANLLEDNNKQAYFIFLREAESKSKRKKEPPSPGVVNIVDLKFQGELIPSF